jgi:hypothetical protein
VPPHRYSHLTWGGIIQQKYDLKALLMTFFRPDRKYILLSESTNGEMSAGKAALITRHSRWPLGKEGNCAGPENRISIQRLFMPSADFDSTPFHAKRFRISQAAYSKYTSISLHRNNPCPQEWVIWLS